MRIPSPSAGASEKSRRSRVRRRSLAFTAKARGVVKRTKVLTGRLERFVADARLSAHERKVLKASVASVRRIADTMVAPQAKPMLGALDQLIRWLDKQTKTQGVKGQLRLLQNAARSALRKATRDAQVNVLPRGRGWAQAFEGVRYRKLRYQGVEVHAVAVDLANPKVRLQTNAPHTRGRHIVHQARAHNAEVVINGDFFTAKDSYRPSGLAMTQGRKWHQVVPGWRSKHSAFEPHLAFNGQRAELLDSYKKTPRWAKNAVSSRPLVLRRGKVVTRYAEPLKALAMPRTAVGLSRGRRVLYLVASDGRSHVKGLTGPQIGRLLRSLGASDGLAMDSGGSAQMYMKKRGMVKRSSDLARQRPVSNVLMVQAQP